MPPPETRGQRLAAALAAHGVSQGELARRLGITRSVVSDMISGRREASLDWLLDAAAAIPCDPAELDPALASRPLQAG
jgi:transcriptional regulator with XRE-family HTH domain